YCICNPIEKSRLLLLIILYTIETKNNVMRICFMLGLFLCAIQCRAQAQDMYAFDFGSGKVEHGYVKVDALMRYTDTSGYGFDLNSHPIAIDRKGNDPLTSDFCTSSSPFFFSVRLPEGNYQVTVLLGDDW